MNEIEPASDTVSKDTSHRDQGWDNSERNKSERNENEPDGILSETQLKIDDNFWELRLYVAGKTAKSVTAFANLKRLCEEYLEGRYRIEVVDLLQNPQLAHGDQILAIPTLVRRLPPPLKKIIGDLSNTARTLVGLNLVPRRAEDSESPTPSEG